MFLPHVQQAINGFEKEFYRSIDLPWRLLDRLGVCFYLQGKYAEAEAMHQHTLQLQETVLGKDHPDTLRSMNNLANSLCQQGKYAEAEAMHWHTLQLQETVLGKDHPDTLRSMNNLANSLCQQGKYAEAEAIRRRADGKSVQTML
jgi:tetratricopeptide (TPR) repeat protein